LYARLGAQYDAILVLSLSSLLAPVMEHAMLAAEQYGNQAAVEVIDSQTIAAGLGLLVQDAAAAAAEGASLADIEQRVRKAIPHIYTLFCIPQLTYLARAGIMDTSQALAGEMLGMLPLFTLEDGQLTPMEKVRTVRHIFESFQNFLSEFESPSRIALVRGITFTPVRTRPIRQYIQESFPEALFSEHPVCPTVAALFGAQTTGLFIMDHRNVRAQ
jgi:DegV family protein with EDD domain